MTKKELVAQIKLKNSYLCVGLDTDIEKLPAGLPKNEKGIIAFNKAIIDATAPYCVGYKINTAFYESQGVKGWEAMEESLAHIPKTHFTIADAKRGDIGNTSAQYAKTFFEVLPFDAITVAPYMGRDSVDPFLAYTNKFTIVLGLTSNAGSQNFQQQKLANGQFIETSIQYYRGQFKAADGIETTAQNYDDYRTAASLIVYPQPFGFQAEYNVGQGPEFDKDKGEVVKDDLKGGYVMVNYQATYKNDRYFPYVRYQEYDGGRKVDNGNRMQTREWEFGTEWQPNPALEITAAYAISDRVVESATTAQNSNQNGQLLRLQAQFNY